MEACLECGACSEEKFLESDQDKSMQAGQMLRILRLHKFYDIKG